MTKATDTNKINTFPSAECFCSDLFNQGHYSECGLIEAARALQEAALQEAA